MIHRNVFVVYWKRRDDSFDSKRQRMEQPRHRKIQWTHYSGHDGSYKPQGLFRSGVPQEKLAKMNSMKTRKKLKSEIEFGPKTRGLSQRQLEAMLRSIVANERRWWIVKDNTQNTSLDKPIHKNHFMHKTILKRHYIRNLSSSEWFFEIKTTKIRHHATLDSQVKKRLDRLNFISFVSTHETNPNNLCSGMNLSQ